MIRRVLLGAAIIAVSLSRLNCDLVFTVDPDPLRNEFLGCYAGLVTEPANGGRLTLVLEVPPGAKDGSNLGGCLIGQEPRFDATLTGVVLEDHTQARLAVMPQGRPAIVVLVTRQPPEGNATDVSLVNESNVPFKQAALPRCPAPTTCADLGIAQVFLPGGGL